MTTYLGKSILQYYIIFFLSYKNFLGDTKKKE